MEAIEKWRRNTTQTQLRTKPNKLACMWRCLPSKEWHCGGRSRPGATDAAWTARTLTTISWQRRRLGWSSNGWAGVIRQRWVLEHCRSTGCRRRRPQLRRKSRRQRQDAVERRLMIDVATMWKIVDVARTNWRVDTTSWVQRLSTHSHTALY